MPTEGNQSRRATENVAGSGDNEPLKVRPKLRRIATSAELLALAENARPNPSPKQLGSKANIFKTPHAIQDVLSYPVSHFELDEPKLRRPKVLVKFMSGKTRVARYGEDMFSRARVNIEQPVIVIRQRKDGDVVISSVQAMDWLSALGEGSADSEESVQIVPAGSFSYRRTCLGGSIRLLMNIHTNANPAKFLCNKQYPPVRLACVVIPRVFYRGKNHLVITQRVSKAHGTYNNLYCFPGGHVEGGETLEEAGSRECYEETGLRIDPETLRLRCCWQEVLPPKQLQFLMLVYSGDYISPSNHSGEFDWNDVVLQKEEVEKLVLVPEEIWDGVAHRSDVGVKCEALIANRKKGCYERGFVPANEITGFQAGFGHGIGSGHRYALMQFLDPFDKHIFGEDSHHIAAQGLRSFKSEEIGHSSNPEAEGDSEESESLGSDRKSSGSTLSRLDTEVYIGQGSHSSWRESLSKVVGGRLSSRRSIRRSKSLPTADKADGSVANPATSLVPAAPTIFDVHEDSQASIKL